MNITFESKARIGDTVWTIVNGVPTKETISAVILDKDGVAYLTDEGFLESKHFFLDEEEALAHIDEQD